LKPKDVPFLVFHEENCGAYAVNIIWIENSHRRILYSKEKEQIFLQGNKKFL